MDVSVSGRRGGDLDDDELVARVANGDMEVLGTLYQRHERMVRRAICRFAPEIPEAQMEELVQDVFLLLCDKASTYQSQGKFKSYLFSIAVRKARTWRRNTWLRRRLLGAALQEELPMAAKPSQPSDCAVELRQVVGQALARLPEKQRVVLMLHAVEGFTGDEIAEILHISAQTVRTRLYRARQLLLENVNFARWSEVLTEEAL